MVRLNQLKRKAKLTRSFAEYPRVCKLKIERRENMKTRMLRKAVATTVAATMVLSVPVYAKEDKKVQLTRLNLEKITQISRLT